MIIIVLLITYKNSGNFVQHRHVNGTCSSLVENSFCLYYLGINVYI